MFWVRKQVLEAHVAFDIVDQSLFRAPDIEDSADVIPKFACTGMHENPSSGSRSQSRARTGKAFTLKWKSL